MKAVVASAVLASALQLGCGPDLERADAQLQVPEEPGLPEQTSVAEGETLGLEGDWWDEPDAGLGARADSGSPMLMPEGDPQVQLQGWTPWVNLGVEITSDPAACTPGRSIQSFVFARGTDNQLIYSYRDLSTGAWIPFRSLGGRLAGSPAAVCQVRPDGTYRFDVYAQGTDQSLIHHYNIPFVTSHWESLGGLMAGMTGPAAAILPTGRQDVFVHWQDGGLRHRFFQGGWSGWMSPIAATLRGDPAAVYTASNRLDLVAVFSDGRLRHTFVENGVWQPWTTLPGVFTSSPEVVSTGPGEMHLFGRAPDNSLLHKRYVNGVWSDWESLGGILTSGPGAAVYDNGRIFVFVRGTDGKLWYRAWAP